MQKDDQNNTAPKWTATVVIEKLVHGGQGLATLDDGRKVFVWGALPKEKVDIRITKRKRNFSEAVVTNVIAKSRQRIAALEPDLYLSTSPWQIMSLSAENTFKQAVLEESFAAEKLAPEWEKFQAGKQRYGYRNKMEYSFWWDNDDAKIHLALHVRGSHQKVIVETSVLASDAINGAGVKLVAFLNDHAVQARQLKSVIIRSQRDGGVMICLYAVDNAVAELPWADLGFKGVHVYYSNPKSPASVATRRLSSVGEMYMSDDVGGKVFQYAPEGFFQVNLEVYEKALSVIAKYVDQDMPLVDLYSGVGSIGMSMPAQTVTCVESDMASIMQARLNASLSEKVVEVVHGEAERALDFITPDQQIIVDPPRAGLHRKVVDRLLEQKPPKIIYLSCNPSTQARDVALLVADGIYTIEHAVGFNFFPATPHIESLVVLKRC